ncbi:class I SAM-dependent methyltransferase [Arenicella xantha]|nr:class I SAM-dependent methyltransferase [Arenicella xantha]
MKLISKWLFSNLLPSNLQDYIRGYHRSAVLKFHIKRLIQTPENYINLESDASRALMDRIIYGWGNPDWSADSRYLQACAAAALKSNSNILECGSGITTLVMAAVTQSSSIQLLALEHVSQWAERLDSVLRDFGFTNCKVLHVPLTNYQKFDWYDKRKFDNGSYSLVVCDGPPGSTKGGRYGLLPIMHKQLQKGSTILLDDCQRADETKILEQWSSEYQLDYKISGTDKKYADITFLGQ